MRILYVTSNWSGLNDLLFKGAEGRGMPAFLKPLRALILRGDDVDLLLIHRYEQLPPLRIGELWANKIRLVGAIFWPHGKLQSLFTQPVLKASLHRLLHENAYDFVYLHGLPPACLGGILRKEGVPFGHRLYGTFLHSQINEQGMWRAKLLRRNEIRIFTERKSFLMVTDDGTRGDQVLARLHRGAPPFIFTFWQNGVDPPAMMKAAQAQIDLGNMGVSTPYLLYIARVEAWKRQDRAIELIHCLHERGVDIRLYYAGQITESTYHQALVRMADSLGLSDRVKYLGVVDKKDIIALAKGALASCSFYEVSNRGNVLYEMLAAGTVMLVQNDGSTSDLIEDGVSGFLVDNPEQAASVVQRLLQQPNFADEIRTCGIQRIHDKICTWERRIEKELALIDQAVKQYRYINKINVEKGVKKKRVD